MNTAAASCPVHQGRDDRKSAQIAEANIAPQDGARVIGSFWAGREVLRSPKVRQAGASAKRPISASPAKSRSSFSTATCTASAVRSRRLFAPRPSSPATRR